MLNVTSCLPGYIAEKANKLQGAGIGSAKVEIELILCHVLDVDRLNLYLHGDRLLDEQASERVDEIIARRVTRYPLQYILEEAWFYGRRFFVSPAVMVPTPETEGLCEAALRYIRSRALEKPDILDVGTGSGVIAITLASELENTSVTAVDVSEDALAVAQRNAHDLDVTNRIEFHSSDFFSALDTTREFDLILSNPPYIREIDYPDLPPEVKADPKIAMTAGIDGLDAIRNIIQGAPEHLAPSGRIMFEIGMGQGQEIAEITRDDPRYKSFTCLKDLNDIDRIVILACDD